MSLSDTFKRSDTFIEIVRALESFRVQFVDLESSVQFVKILAKEKDNMRSTVVEKFQQAQLHLLKMFPNVEYDFRTQQAMSFLSSTSTDTFSFDGSESPEYFCTSCNNWTSTDRCKPCRKPSRVSNDKFREEWNCFCNQQLHANALSDQSNIVENSNDANLDHLHWVDTAFAKAAEQSKSREIVCKDLDNQYFQLMAENEQVSSKKRVTIYKFAKRAYRSVVPKASKSEGKERSVGVWQGQSKALEVYVKHRSQFLANFVFSNDSCASVLQVTSFDNILGHSTFCLSYKVETRAEAVLHVQESAINLNCSSDMYELLYCFVESRGFVCTITQNRIDLRHHISVIAISEKKRVVPSSCVVHENVQSICHAAYISGDVHFIAIVFDAVESESSSKEAFIYCLTNGKDIEPNFISVSRRENEKLLAIKGIQFIPKVKYLSILYEDNAVCIWSVHRRRPRATLHLLESFGSLSYSPDGNYVIVAKAINTESVKLHAYKLNNISGDMTVSNMTSLSPIDVCANLSLPVEFDLLVTAVAKDEIMVSFVHHGVHTLCQHCRFPLDPNKIDADLIGIGNGVGGNEPPVTVVLTALKECFRVFAPATPCKSDDVMFAEKLTLVRAKSDLLDTNLQETLRKWLGQHVIDSIVKQGKRTEQLTFLANCAIESLESLDNYTTGRKISLGNWLLSLVKLLPVQIVQANRDGILQINCGFKVMTLERLSMENEEKSSFFCDAMNLGPIESVIEHYDGRVKVVSNIGRTSTGKSYFGNHLIGSLFEVGATKCTNGVWISCRSISCGCSYCKSCLPSKSVHPCLLVAFDVEGFDSIDRVLLGDTLLSQLVFSLSSVIFLNTRDRSWDRSMLAMFRDFAFGVARLSKSSSGSEKTCQEYGNLIHGDKTLFTGTLVLLMKDVQPHEFNSLNKQCHGEFKQTKENFPELQVLFRTITSGLLQNTEKRQYYDGVEMLFEELVVKRSSCLFHDGAWFLRKLREVTKKLMTNENTSLRIDYIKSMRDHVQETIEDALIAGRFSSLNKRQVEISDSCELSIKPFIVDGVLGMPKNTDKKYAPTSSWEISSSLLLHDDCYEMKDTGDGPEQLLSQLFYVFQEILPRTESNENDWLRSFSNFVSEVVNRRGNKVRQWIKQLAKTIDLTEKDIEEIVPPDVARRIRQFPKCFLVCGEACGKENCRFTCLLPKPEIIGHGHEHNCLNKLHSCECLCVYECRNRNNGTILQCAKGRGHAGISKDAEHKCNSENHQCRQVCRFYDYGCSERCRHSAGHDGNHDCKGRHNCKNKCSIPLCQGQCSKQVDNQHSLCLCSESHCMYRCDMPHCFNFCVHVHGHVADKSSPHLCGEEHLCPALCQHDGVCKRVNPSDRSHLEYVRVSDETGEVSEASKEYHRQILQVARCASKLNALEVKHEGRPHFCNSDFHSCPSMCQLCHRLCDYVVGHPGRHGIRNGHGKMLYAFAAWRRSKDTNKDIKKYQDDCRRYSICQETCATVCSLPDFGGRGHVHVVSDDDDSISNSLALYDLHLELIPDDDHRKLAVSHTEFWKRMNFEDPHYEDDFDLCYSQCQKCQSSFCTRELMHSREVSHNGSQACLQNECSFSIDGHHFKCCHTPKFHIVLVLDCSFSMKNSDFVPPKNEEFQIHISFQNRFGAITVCAMKLLQGHNWIDDRCTVTMVTFAKEGFLLFQRQSVTNALDIMKKMLGDGVEVSTPVDHSSRSNDLIRLSVYDRNLSACKQRLFAKGTSFAAGLEKANVAIEENLRSDESQLVVFFTDGRNNSSTKADIEKQVRQLGKWRCKPPKLHVIYSAKNVSPILQKMKSWLENEVSGRSDTGIVDLLPHTEDWKSVEEQFTKIAASFQQEKFVVARSSDYNDELAMSQSIVEVHSGQHHAKRLARLMLSNSVFFKIVLFLIPKREDHIFRLTQTVRRQDTSLLLFGDSHCCQAEIIKELATVNGFIVEEIDLGRCVRKAQRNQISRAFETGRVGKRMSRILLLFKDIDLAFDQCSTDEGNSGQPELLIQLALLKIDPPTDVDLCVCCTSSKPWLINDDLVRAFSLIVEISHPTKQEIDKIVNCYLNLGRSEERNCLKEKLTGHKVVDIYRWLKQSGNDIEDLLQEGSAPDNSEYIPDQGRKRFQTEKDGLQYFNGKVRLLELNHTPRHCGIFVESDISKVYSDNLLGKQTFESIIGQKVYEDINIYCQQFGMSQTVNSALFVGSFRTLCHWISSFIANKLEALYVWLNADMLEFVDLPNVFLQSLLSTDKSSVVIYVETLDKASIDNRRILQNWVCELKKARKFVHILVSTSSDCKEASERLVEEAQWPVRAIFEHHLISPFVRARQLKLFLEIYYSNWSNISDPHISWIVSVTEEKSTEDMWNLLKNAFDRILLDYVNCKHVQAVELTKFDEPRPPNNGHYFIASSPEALGAVELTEKIRGQADFKLTPRRLRVEDVASVLKIPLHLYVEKLGKVAPFKLLENRKGKTTIECNSAVLSAEIQLLPADNPTLETEYSFNVERSQIQEELKAATKEMDRELSQISAFFCRPSGIDPPCDFTKGEYRLGPVFHFNTACAEILFETFKASMSLPNGFLLADTDICLQHSATEEWQLPNWKVVQCCHVEVVTKFTKQNQSGPLVEFREDEMSFITRNNFGGYWAWTKSQSALEAASPRDFVACLYAAQPPLQGEWEFRIYVVTNDKLKVGFDFCIILCHVYAKQTVLESMGRLTLERVCVCV